VCGVCVCVCVWCVCVCVYVCMCVETYLVETTYNSQYFGFKVG